MKLLTRQEEQILLAIYHLGEEAYLVNIREQLKEITGKYLDVGSINKPLKRLHERDFLATILGESTPVRGGKRIKFYSMTEKGFEALAQVKSSHERMWQNVVLPTRPA
ncbi:MarR family transcriptional regulator [bacterium]|nr:MarR family transcriptional regulator [bacterium]